MRTQSSSSLSTYQKCPHAYQLKYIDKLPPETTEDMNFGSWVEDEIFKDDCHEDALAYKEAFEDWLKDNDDEVIDRQVHIQFEISGFSFQGYLDIVTKNGILGEMKVTGSPQFYQSYLSYQVRMYNLWAAMQEKPMLSKYLLFEKDKKTKAFKKLHVPPIVTTDLTNAETIMFLDFICSKIELNQEYQSFEPSFNECYRCLMKKHCSHYWGF